MTIRYEGQRYHVSPCDKIYVSYEKAILLLKRWKRRIRLILRKEDMFLYLLITACWVLFGIGMYIMGQKHIATQEDPYRIIEVIWEIKGSYFTSVILAFVIGVVGRIREYRKKIYAQHSVYVIAMSDFQKLIDPYIGDERLHYRPFYNEKCLNDTISHIRINAPKAIQTNNMWQGIFLCILHRLQKVEQEFINGNIVVYTSEQAWILREIDEARNWCYQLQICDIIQLDDVIKLSKLLKQIIDYLREPWRIDIRSKIRILECLDRYSENEIEENFYYKMLLIGHTFKGK